MHIPVTLNSMLPDIAKIIVENFTDGFFKQSFLSPVIDNAGR